MELSVRDLRFDISKFNPSETAADSEPIGGHASDTRTGEPEPIVSGTQANGPIDKAPEKRGEQVDKSQANRLNYLIDDESYDVKNNLEVNSKFRKILTFS